MTTKSSGQVLPIVALLMVCFIGLAALAIDGSNTFSQQRRMQADLDMAVTFAAADLLKQPITSTVQSEAVKLLVQRGYTNTSPGIITINVPPLTAPYMQAACPSPLPRPCYVEGFLTQNVRSFFAGVLGLKSLKISVHAVAETGGNTWQPPTLLALSPDGASNGGCGFAAQGGAGVSGILDASVHSNSQTCVKSGSLYATGEVVSDIKTTASNGNPITSTANVTAGNGTGTFMPNPYNPDWKTSTLPASPAPAPLVDGGTKCNNHNNPCTSLVCGGAYTINDGDTYYQPGVTGVARISRSINTSGGTGAIDFLPSCGADGTGAPTYGIYLFDADFSMSSNSTVVNVYNSTFVFNYLKGAKLWVTGGNLNMNVKDMNGSLNSASPFHPGDSSIAIWQVNTESCGTPTSMQLAGGGTGTIQGIVDLPCTDISVTGSSQNSAWITGGLVAWTITVAGSGSGVVKKDLSVTPPLPSGSALVQ